MNFTKKDYCYEYWIAGTIKDASKYKIYQNDKLVYDSTTSEKPLDLNLELDLDLKLDFEINDTDDLIDVINNYVGKININEFT
jgi:hypothetical protein